MRSLLFLTFLILATMAGFVPTGSAKKLAPTVDDCRQIVEENLHSGKISASDWDVARKNYREAFLSGYAVMPPRGGAYDRLAAIYTELRSSGMVPDDAVLHVVRPLPNTARFRSIAGTIARDVFVNEEAIELLDEDMLAGVLAHELRHGIDDWKRLSIVTIARFPARQERDFRTALEAHVDYFATMVLFKTGEDPRGLKRFLDLALTRGWIDEPQYEVRRQWVEKALADIETIKTSTPPATSAATVTAAR